jgi:cellulose synthase/poly-beta-1,6-N-acetylglucosamine synthase-like glycosyltransferase
MDILTHLLLLSTTLYTGVALLFFIGLFRLKTQPQTTDKPFISVVIAARNEANYIGECLDCMKRQTYPTDRFEILVVDDDSTDDTSVIVASAQIDNLRLLTVGDCFPEMAAKKRPMSVGIQQAKGEWILTTDSDCKVPTTWVEQMAAYMTADTGVVIGFSQLKTSAENLTFFERLQAFDFLTLMAAAAGATGLGFPLAASGQNLAYRKDIFDRVGGFSSIGHRPSGDDVLLLQLLRRVWNGRFAFATHPKTFVSTWRSETPASFSQQRRRWASNAAYQLKLNPTFFIYIATIFVTNALIPLAFVMAIFNGNYLLPTACWFAKTFADLLVTWRGAHIFGRTDLLPQLPLWELFQAPYTVLIGLAGTLSGFTWKGRHHQS